MQADSGDGNWVTEPQLRHMVTWAKRRGHNTCRGFPDELHAAHPTLCLKYELIARARRPPAYTAWTSLVFLHADNQNGTPGRLSYSIGGTRPTSVTNSLIRATVRFTSLSGSRSRATRQCGRRRNADGGSGAKRNVCIRRGGQCRPSSTRAMRMASASVSCRLPYESLSPLLRRYRLDPEGERGHS